MSHISRRALHKLLLAAPAAALTSADADAQTPKPSGFASCIAASETTLSPAERGRLAAAIGGLEQSLKAIREFKLPPDADPAMHFRPMRSRGSR